MVLATSRKTQDKELPLGGLFPVASRVGVVVEFVCLFAVPIGRLGRLPEFFPLELGEALILQMGSPMSVCLF